MKFTKYFSGYLFTLLVCGSLHAAVPDALLANKWYLAILNQQALTLADFKDQKAFIQFTADNSFTAYVGCHNLSGTFTAAMPNELSFTNIVVADDGAVCTDKFTALETEFVTILQKTTIWELENKVLSFKNNPENRLAIALFTSVQPQ